MRIIFVRHGQTKWNLAGRYQGQTDTELSSLGFAQACCLAKHFPLQEKISAIYSSDLTRAAQTAEVLARSFACEMHLRQALRELNFGRWEGLTRQQMEAEWPELATRFFVCPEKETPPEGESFSCVQKRAMAEIKGLQERWRGNKNIVVVAHGAVLRAVLAACLHIPLKYVWSIRQDNTAVSIVRFEPENCYVELLNGTAHLQFLEK